MAAAYAALVSLTNTMDLIASHPRHSSSFDQNHIDSLREYARSFLQFTVSHDSRGRSKQVEDLEIEIASAASMAEDLLESHVFDQIVDGLELESPRFFTKMKVLAAKVVKVPEELRSKVDAGYRERKRVLEKRSSYLQEILENRMRSIMEKAGKAKEEFRARDEVEQPPDFMAAAAASSTPLITRKASRTMVGFDGYSFQLMDVLTGQQSSRQIISVVGMGGSGKTTLARNVYELPLIILHFDIRAWATISQLYNAKEILSQLLSGLGKFRDGEADELGEQLHKKLWGRRYLIVLDDMWSGEAWDRIRSYLPDNGNGSRVVVTTRLSSVASYFTTSTLEMELLDEDKSWELFCAKTFGEEEDCPLELVDIGKKIVAQCKGLPLSIVVIGGHLRNCSRTEEQWVEVARNMISFLNSGEEQCLSIMSLSYSHLPPYLKPCFLYMGIFQEDEEILVSTLVRLWIAEGFLQIVANRSLEEIAEGCLKDLVDRNLISAGKKGRNGKLSTCNIHDLMRELCLKVGEKEKFFCVLKHPAAASRCSSGCPICNIGRFSIDECRLLRIMRKPNEELNLSIDECRLLRIMRKPNEELNLKFMDENSLGIKRMPSGDLNLKFRRDFFLAIFQYFNLRNIFMCLYTHSFPSMEVDTQGILSHRHGKAKLVLPSCIYLNWNLQTLVIHGLSGKFIAPVEIWKMPQLRHVNMTEVIRIPDPPPAEEDDSIMSNLRTLSVVENFKLVEEVSRRIPNIEALELRYGHEVSWSSSPAHYQHNLGRFHKLESLKLKFGTGSNHRSFALRFRFPASLQELWLENSSLQWEDLSMIGSLSNLETLMLTGKNSIKGSEWNPVEGEFLGLKSLTINSCGDLVCWNGERSHFPVLESLRLGCAYKLAEFPSDIGEIPTLELIHVDECSVAAAISAVMMLVEQEELGNDDLRLEIQLKDEKELEKVKKMVEEEGIESKNLRLNCYASY